MNNIKLSEDLKDFIIFFCNKMKIKNIDDKNIELDTSLDLDLNIFDLDMDIFIVEFIKRFNIHLTQLELIKKIGYPNEKEMSFLYSIIRSFNYKNKWVRKICRKLYTPKIYIRSLQMVINDKA